MFTRPLLRRGLAAAAAILSALLFTATPAVAQKDLTTDNVVDIFGVLTSPGKAGAKFHFRRTQGGVTWHEQLDERDVYPTMVEKSRSAMSVTLGEDNRIVVLDLANRTLTETVAGAAGAIGTISSYTAETCTWRTAPGSTCTCDLRLLHPLQGAVGLGEVAKKKKDIQDEHAKEWADFQKDPIPIVRGSALTDFHVIDHHHGARAWLEAGYTMGVCKYQAELGLNDPPRFWREVAERKWVHLADERGQVITPQSLPATLDKVPNDPYRTLAWMVRKKDGFCRALMNPPPPFAEFLWADAMRRSLPHVSLDQVKAATDPTLWEPRSTDKKGDLKARRDRAQKAVLDAALQWATSPAAAQLPGYQGSRGLRDEACNPKDNE